MQLYNYDTMIPKSHKHNLFGYFFGSHSYIDAQEEATFFCQSDQLYTLLLSGSQQQYPKLTCSPFKITSKDAFISEDRED